MERMSGRKNKKEVKKIPQVIILFKSLVLWTVEVEEHPFVLDIHKICYLTKPFVTVRLSLNILRTEYEKNEPKDYYVYMYM